MFQVSKQGKVGHILRITLQLLTALQVCVAELGRLWTSDIKLKEILTLVYGLLLEPDLENPLEIQASLKYCESGLLNEP
jgi:ubiquitin-protein ligase